MLYCYYVLQSCQTNHPLIIVDTYIKVTTNTNYKVKKCAMCGWIIAVRDVLDFCAVDFKINQDVLLFGIVLAAAEERWHCSSVGYVV